MSVDSFIQQRISLDASSTSEHSSAAVTPHLTTFLNPQSSNSSSLNALTGPGGIEPAVDPRWQMALPGGADAQHAFFRSIESELPETDRIAIHLGPDTPPTPGYGQPNQHQQEVGTSKRHSVLRGRPKLGGKFPLGHGGGVLNASASTIGSSSSVSYGDLGRAASMSISSTRRPAVPSAGVPLPSSGSSSNLPAAPASSSTTATARRPTTSGSGSVSNVRARTYSLGGSNGAKSASAPAVTASANSSNGASLPPPPPLRLTTDYPVSPQTEGEPQEDTSEYCIAIVGSMGCGKSMLIRKVIKSYTIVESRTFNVGDAVVDSFTVHVNVTDNRHPQAVRILEVDSSLVAHPDNLWPPELPGVDGVLLCYDASNEDSFTRIPELLAGYYALGHALVILACKSDLHRVVSPSRANAIGKQYDIGLIEVSSKNEPGKQKIRNCFVWEVKAIGRHRRHASKNAIPQYRNPASPEILSSRIPWDDLMSTPTRAMSTIPPLPNRHHAPTSSSRSSLQRSTNNSAPVLPLLDTYTHSSSISHSTGGTGTGTSSLNGNDNLSPSVPSTARTSFDSVVLAGAGAGAGASATQQQPLQSASSSSSGPSSRARSTSDVLSTASKIPLVTGTNGPSVITPSPTPHGQIATNVASDGTGATSPQLDVASSPGTAVPAGGGSGPVTEGGRQQREGSSLQWATLDEILDKLLFVSVSGDDPVFIQHFFLTYRRFATPRSVLLGMQKRMIELGKETRDPLLAKFAQMRICNLLSQWKENYPNDFGAPGTFGALQALLKQVVSNVHLVHYASDLIPFLDEVPKLIDRESTWCKKEETVGADDSEDESADETDDGYIPRLEDDEEAYVGRGGAAFERRTRTPASSNPPAPQGRQMPSGAERPYHAAGSNSAPNVATVGTSSDQGSFSPTPRPALPIRAGFEQETVFTHDRQVGRNARVNVKELQRVAHAIMQTETLHIAQEITRRMLFLFKKIEARDWLRRTMSKKDYARDQDPIGKLTRLFNYLVCWVSAMIVSFDRVSQRAKVLDKMVVVAKSLRQLNNYMGMNAFVAGINNVRGQDDDELTQLMASRPNSNWKQFKSLQVLVGTARSGQVYRTALKHTPGAAIPDLERHGSDIFRAEEGNLDYSRTDPNLIHWGKFTILGKLVGTVTLYQNRCHTMADYRDLEERPHISQLVFDQIVWDLETLTNREHRAWEEAQTTESSSGLRRLLPFKV